MAHVLANLVKQTSHSSGSTEIELTGPALSPYRDFSEVLSNGDTTEAMVVRRGSSAWQAAVYTFADDVLTLVPDHWIASSSGSVVTFAAGVKDVYIPPLAEKGRTFRRTADFDAISSFTYDVDTSDGAIEATLPASPAEADRFYFNDFAGTWETNHFSVNANGQEFENAGTDNVRAFPETGLLCIVFSDGKYRVRTPVIPPANAQLDFSRSKHSQYIPLI